jgi:outer membrane protein assembly factor BamB/tetratricopeptide (TPR) repeat protein
MGLSRMALAACLAVLAARAQEPTGSDVATATGNTNTASLRDPIASLYRAYDPGFRFPEKMEDENRRLSSEPRFFSLNLVPESPRANALVEAGKAKEAEGQYKEAMDVYQKVIDEYPDMLYRISDYGVFVAITEYCQSRILSFPPDAQALYRTKFDSRAKDAYELARQRNSLEGLAQVRDCTLATSYGVETLKTLGFSALDKGHYLEALEYFERVWELFPESRATSPSLALSIALCRRLLGQELSGGPQHGLIGHWKLDEGKGNRVADASGNGNEGVVGNPPDWTGQGKLGARLHIDWSNGVTVAGSRLLDIGVGGSDFTVSFWIRWESGAYPNYLFIKRGRSADEMLALEVNRKNQVQYAVSTQSTEWERGVSKGTIANKDWTHVALVKEGLEIRIFLDGRLDTRDTLKLPVVKNLGSVSLGQYLYGTMDDVRLYRRALLDREVATLAGTAGVAPLEAAPVAGVSPLTVQFACPSAATNDGRQYFWEFGDGETARGPRAKHAYGLGGEYTARLTVTDPKGPVSTASRAIRVTWRPQDTAMAGTMERILAGTKYAKPAAPAQLGSAPHVGANDYLLMPPTDDLLGLRAPTWEKGLAGSRQDVMVFSQPIVTGNSVVYRHKNIIYCHSILNGELRWKNDLGGRVTWQNWGERQYHQEDVLVQDGMLFTPMFKVGPTLVALDEITGRLRWAYGPMTATTPEEANLRFESAPAGGPMTVYAGYILDNIEGETHTDTEYGVMAFDSVTGRIKWRTRVCSLRPGLFQAGFAVRRRNRIRSFTSPPLYHQGTVYYCSNAGAIVALDALSGRVKWLMRYPYYDGIHDATHAFGGGHHYIYLDRPTSPMLWYGTRPLLIGDHLYVTPVNGPALLCLQRRDGRVLWQFNKPSSGVLHFLGADRAGELVLACDGRSKYHTPDGSTSGPPLYLLDPETGKPLWTAPDLIVTNDHAVTGGDYDASFTLCQTYYTKGARPFLTADDHVVIPDYYHIGWPVFGYALNLADVDLGARRIVGQRRYYTGEVIAHAEAGITREAPQELKQLQDLPHKDERAKERIRVLQEVVADTVPVNEQGPFMPFSRVTFSRYGVPFELRTSARTVAMVYDRARVKQAVAGRSDPEGLFARAELAVAENRLPEAADLMAQCLARISSEDVDFRASVNQLLYQVHKELVRSAIRRGDKAAEFASCTGMSRAATTLADEVETLFAVAEAQERRGDCLNAARLLQGIADVYGRYEYPVPEALAVPPETMGAEVRRLLGAAAGLAGSPLFGPVLRQGIEQLKTTVPVYRSAVSPLPKTLTMRAGELAAASLTTLQRSSPPFAAAFEKLAESSLLQRTPEEQLTRLWEFPGTRCAQSVLESQLRSTDNELRGAGDNLEQAARLRRRLWTLAESARICGLQLPEAFRGRLLAPAARAPALPLAFPMTNAVRNLEEARGTAWLALPRREDRAIRPELLFLGGRVKKKFDNKFVLYALDTRTGEVAWKATEKRGDQTFDEIRLQGKGDEPGFCEAFVHGQTVIVHGLYDVLAFDLADGRLAWRYEAPFAFEIRHAVKSGDLLVLAGQSETLALYLPTRDPRGELVWQQKEEGDIHVPPYFCGDRLVSLRKAPSNLTVRYRSTGEMMGRLALPDLLPEGPDPLVANGPAEVPAAADGRQLLVSDGSYYLMLDVERLAVVWKRLIDANDPSHPPPLRFALAGDYLAIVKQDFDTKAIYMLSSATGELLWRTDPKQPGSPQPISSLVLNGNALYGILPHPGQGYYFAGLDCRTGKPLFPPQEQKGYGGKPEVQLIREPQGGALVALVKDRQDFEIRAFDLQNGRLQHTLKVKATGEFGEHGRISGTVQNGVLALLGKNELVISAKK